MAREPWIESQWQEVETCLKNNNDKKAYQLVMDLTTEKKGKSTTYKTSQGRASHGEHEILNRRTDYCSDLYNYETDTQRYFTAQRHQMEEHYSI